MLKKIFFCLLLIIILNCSEKKLSEIKKVEVSSFTDDWLSNAVNTKKLSKELLCNTTWNLRKLNNHLSYYIVFYNDDKAEIYTKGHDYDGAKGSYIIDNNSVTLKLDKTLNNKNIHKILSLNLEYGISPYYCFTLTDKKNLYFDCIDIPTNPGDLCTYQINGKKYKVISLESSYFHTTKETFFKDIPKYTGQYLYQIKGSFDTGNNIDDMTILQGEKLKVIGKSIKKDTINGFHDYWYLISYNNGLIYKNDDPEDINHVKFLGWIFGGHLEKKNIEQIEVGADNNKKWQLIGNRSFSPFYTKDLSFTVFNGIPFVGYSSTEKNDQVSVMQYFDNKQSFFYSGQISTEKAFSPELFTQNSKLYLLYRVNSTPKKNTHFSMFGYNELKLLEFSNGKWSKVGQSPEISVKALYQSLFVYDDTPYIAYSDGDHDGKLTVIRYKNNKWKKVGKPGFSTGKISWTKVFVDNKIPYVAFSDDENNDTLVVMKYKNNKWVTVGKNPISDGEVGLISLYIYNSIPYLAFTDYKNSESITVMKYNNDSWTVLGKKGITGYNTAYPSLIVENDIPYIAFRDYRYSGKISVLKYVNNKWISVGKPGFSGLSDSHDVTLHINHGKPIVSFTAGNQRRASIMIYQ